MLDEDLLLEYMSKHYGYGNYGGKYWLIGMEEGGGENAEEIQTRLRIWKEHGQRELADVAEFDADDRLGRWYGPSARILQPTFCRLIRTILSAQGSEVNRESILRYQADLLGRPDGNSCLLELLPLPSGKVDQWIYRDFTTLPQLRDRVSYRNFILENRINHLRKRLLEHDSEAKIVIFYSTTYRAHWERIAGSKFNATEIQNLYVARQGKTVCAMMPQPTYTGLTKAFFEDSGRLLATML